MSASIPRWRTCASSNTCGTVLIGPQGTPAASSRAIQSAVSRSSRSSAISGRQHREIAHASGILREALVARPFRPSEHLAAFGELAVVADHQHHVAVAGGEDVLRLDVGMGIAGAARHLAGDQIVHRLVGEARHADVEHGDVDVVAAAGLVAARERRQHRDRRVHARS